MISHKTPLTNCHQREGSIPVCAVTDLSNNILISNFTPGYAISKARVFITRFYNSSTAMFVAQANLPERDSPYPELDGALRESSEICIYLGYLHDRYREVTVDDINNNNLLRVFVGVIDSISATSTHKGSSIMWMCRDRLSYLSDSIVNYSPISDSNILGDLEKSFSREGRSAIARSRVVFELCKRGIGYLRKDCNVCGRLLRPGIIMDPSLFVADPASKSVLKNYDLESFSNEGGSVIPPDDRFRPDLLYNDLYSLNVEVTKVDRGFLFLGPKTTTTADLNLIVPDPKEIIRNNEVGELVLTVGTKAFDREPVESLRAEPVNKKLPTSDLVLNIILGRRQYKGNGSFLSSAFSLSDRTPLEYMKFMAGQEIYPTEVYQDHRNGQYYFVPKVNDVSGLNNPRLYNRTYYVRSDYGDDVDFNQMLLRFKDEASSLTVRTNFIVSNSNTSPGGGGSVDNLIKIHLKTVPSYIKDNQRFPCKFVYANDPMIETVEEAAIIAVQMASLLGRQARAVTCAVIGDPSLCPNEVIQIYGSPLNSSMTKEDYLAERADFLEYNEVYNGTWTDLAISIRDAQVRGQPKPTIITDGTSVGINRGSGRRRKNPKSDGNLVEYETMQGGKVVNKFTAYNITSESPDNVLCSIDYESQGSIDKPIPGNAYLKKPPESLFRIEALTHKFNDDEPGYVTELLCMAAY